MQLLAVFFALSGSSGQATGPSVSDLLSLAISSVALIISFVVLLREAAPLSFTKGESCRIPNHLFYVQASGNECPLQVNTKNEWFYALSLGCTNPKPHAVSIYDIRLADQNGQKLPCFVLATLPAHLKGIKLFVRDGQRLLVLNPPQSDYDNIDAGQFTYFDFLVPVAGAGEIKQITLTFRDSLPTILPKKLAGAGWQRHRTHRFTYHVSELKAPHQLP